MKKSYKYPDQSCSSSFLTHIKRKIFLNIKKNGMILRLIIFAYIVIENIFNRIVFYQKDLCRITIYFLYKACKFFVRHHFILVNQSTPIFFIRHDSPPPLR